MFFLARLPWPHGRYLKPMMSGSALSPGSVKGLSWKPPLVAQATTGKQTSPPAHGPQEADERDADACFPGICERVLRLLWRSLDGVPSSK